MLDITRETIKKKGLKAAFPLLWAWLSSNQNFFENDRQKLKDYENEVTVFETQFNRLTNDQRKGILTAEGYRTSINILTFAILEFLNELEEVKLHSNREEYPVTKNEAEAGPIPSKHVTDDPFVLKRSHGVQSLITRMSWSQNGEYLAIPTIDKAIHIYDASEEKLIIRISGHEKWVFSTAWAPIGNLLASCSEDGSVFVWDIDSARKVSPNESISVIDKPSYTFEHGKYVLDVTWSKDGKSLFSAGYDKTVKIWSLLNKSKHQSIPETDWINCIALSPDGKTLAIGTSDQSQTISLWDWKKGELIKELRGHKNFLTDLVWMSERKLISSSGDHTIRIWDVKSGRQIQSLEKHTDYVCSVTLSPDGHWLASKSLDETVRIWDTQDWLERQIIAVPPQGYGFWETRIAFSPHKGTLRLAIAGGKDREIQIYEREEPLVHFSNSTLNSPQGDPKNRDSPSPISTSSYYKNAKVIFLGDTGVGKTALSEALCEQDYRPTDSTQGRMVHQFYEDTISFKKGGKEVREIFLWDMAGQPGYRLIHQLHLHEVSVVLLVFDAKNELDPFSSLKYWQRALAQAIQNKPELQFHIFLVAGRIDVQGVSVSKLRLETFRQEIGADDIIKTSAKTPEGIDVLKKKIISSIKWQNLPKATLSDTFHQLKKIFEQLRAENRLLCRKKEVLNLLEKEHLAQKHDIVHSNLVFLENRDLIRRLDFGGYILLEPELLDNYASSIIFAAKNEPDGFGAILVSKVDNGNFNILGPRKIEDPVEEKLVITSTIQELVKHELVTKEDTGEGQYYIFPSQAQRDWPEAPDPEGKSIAFIFEGAIRSIYGSLCVRLSHTGFFALDRNHLWKNAAIFTHERALSCGIYLREFGEGKGEIIIFYHGKVEESVKKDFESFIYRHLSRDCIKGSLEKRRFISCSDCEELLPPDQIRKRKERGYDWITCGVCDHKVFITSKSEPKSDDDSNEGTANLAELSHEKREELDGELILEAKKRIGQLDAFISFRNSDEPEVQEINTQLRKKGVTTWTYIDNSPGDEWQEELEKALEKAKACVVMIGNEGMSAWQFTEARTAQRIQHDGGAKKIIPVILPSVISSSEVPNFLKAYQVLDMRSSLHPIKDLIKAILKQ